MLLLPGLHTIHNTWVQMWPRNAWYHHKTQASLTLLAIAPISTMVKLSVQAYSSPYITTRYNPYLIVLWWLICHRCARSWVDATGPRSEETPCRSHPRLGCMLLPYHYGALICKQGTFRCWGMGGCCDQGKGFISRCLKQTRKPGLGGDASNLGAAVCSDFPPSPYQHQSLWTSP